MKKLSLFPKGVVDGERPLKVYSYDLGFFSLKKLNPSPISDFCGSKILKGLLNKENPIIRKLDPDKGKNLVGRWKTEWIWSTTVAPQLSSK
jgi:hypothetical protein